MPQFRKKPVTVTAVQWTGDNTKEIVAFCGGSSCVVLCKSDFFNEPYFAIHTLEGEMKASVGDWIIKGVHGEFYPCKPDIFEKTYEPVKETP